jgi:hypothetical protein
LQSAPVKRAFPAKVIAFHKPMGTPAPSIPPADSGVPKKRWDSGLFGNLAQWVAPAVTLLIGIVTVGTVIHYRNADAADRKSTLEINDLIDKKLNPDVEKINESVEKKLDPINQRLAALDERLSDVQGQLKRMGGDFQAQKKTQNQLLAIDRVQNPNRILGVIRSEIQLATENKTQLPVSNLVDYRYILQALPPSAREYWTTVADIINYQSLLNQKSGIAPDPATVSHPCAGLTAGTGGYNVQVGGSISRCVLDLDATHNLLENLTIRDSVVRYRGGPIELRNVTFVNCSFILDLPEPLQTPARPDLLRSLLESDQKRVTLSTHS